MESIPIAAPRPLFSVIIPTYDRAQKVIRAIESVLKQTFTDFDLWVIDDGSTDDTEQVLKPYRERIHYLSIANSGTVKARNFALRQSTGRYIAFLDSDDWWYPQKLAVYAAAIQAHPEVGLFYSQCEMVTEEGERMWIDRSRSVRGSAYLPLLKGNFIALSSAVVRCDCLADVGLFNEIIGYTEDFELWVRIARRYPIRLVPQVLTVFEYVAQGKKTNNIPEWLQAHDRVLETAFNLDPSLDERTRREIRAHIAYVKGRICVEGGDDQTALQWFNQATTLQPGLLKAHVYRLILSAPAVRALLPRPILRRLRFPVPSEGRK